MTTRERRDGAYYREGFKNAHSHSRGGILSITSFNEWGEGTQIEPAVTRSGKRTYLDYGPRDSGFLSREMSGQLHVPSDCGVT